MTLQRRTITELLSTTRTTGATYINSSGRLVGVDFATTTAQAAATGSRTYTVGTNRDWKINDPVVVRPRDGTVNIQMDGVVTDYNNTTGVLTINTTVVGSDTTTTKTDWRIGYKGPRLDHSLNHNFVAQNPRAGLMLESEARTNEARNGDCIGSTTGTIGSGGVYPTNMTTAIVSSCNFAIQGSGVDPTTGLSYFDLRVWGTRNGVNAPAVRLLNDTHAVAAPGEGWVGSLYCALVGGSMTNITNIQFNVNERDSGGGFLTSSGGVNSFIPTAQMTRFAKARNITNRLTTRVSMQLVINVPDLTDFDVTLRLAGLQLERIRTPERTGTAQAGGASTITLDAGASSVNDIYNGMTILTTGGTGSGQTKTITAYNGTTKVATVDSGWSTNPDATTTFAIYRTGTTDIEGAASSYIPTRQIAETRAAELIDAANFTSLFGTPAGYTLLVEARTPGATMSQQSPDQHLAVLWENATNNVALYRTIAGTNLVARVLDSGNTQATLQGPGSGLLSTQRMAVAVALNDVALSVNGAASLTDTTTPDGIPAPTALRLGRLNDSAPTGSFMGWFRKLRVIPRRLANTRLEALL